MNTCQLTGRLTKDPEVRYKSDNQMAIGRFTLAVDKNYKKKKDEKPNFINIVCFGKTAEFVEKYARKGKRLAVINGEITTGSYEKDGRTVYTTDIVAGQVEVIDWPDSPKEETVNDNFEAVQEDVPF